MTSFDYMGMKTAVVPPALCSLVMVTTFTTAQIRNLVAWWSLDLFSVYMLSDKEIDFSTVAFVFSRLVKMKP